MFSFVFLLRISASSSCRDEGFHCCDCCCTALISCRNCVDTKCEMTTYIYIYIYIYMYVCMYFHIHMNNIRLSISDFKCTFESKTESTRISLPTSCSTYVLWNKKRLCGVSFQDWKALASSQLIPRIPDTDPHASPRSRQDRQDLPGPPRAICTERTSFELQRGNTIFNTSFMIWSPCWLRWLFGWWLKLIVKPTVYESIKEFRQLRARCLATRT